MKNKKKYFIVWLENRVDMRDDKPIKILANDRSDALDIAENYTQGRFDVGYVFTMSEFRGHDRWWYNLLKKNKARNE